MTTSELVKAVAAAAETGEAETQHILDVLLAEIQATLARGDQVTLPGFGKFSTAHRAGRLGRNPRTGAAMTIPPTTYARFTPGAGLKTAVKDVESKPSPTRAQRTRPAPTVNSAAEVSPTKKPKPKASKGAKKKDKAKKKDGKKS